MQALCALLLILGLFPAFAQTPGDPTATPQYPDLPFEEVTEEPVGPVVQSEGMAVEHRADISQSCLLAIKNLSLSCEPVDPSGNALGPFAVGQVVKIITEVSNSSGSRSIAPRTITITEPVV